MSACLASAMDYLHNRCKRQRTSAKTARAVLVEQGLLVSLSFVKRDGDSVLFCLFPLFSTFAASFSTFVSFSPSPHLTNVTIGTLSSMWTITFPFSPLVLTLFSPFYRKLITLFSPYSHPTGSLSTATWPPPTWWFASMATRNKSRSLTLGCWRLAW